MTATEMLQSFNYSINQSNNYNLFTWDVAFWLNRAQDEVFNAYYYQDETKASPYSVPMTSYQDTARSADVLHPFVREITAFSDASGFLPTPAPGIQYSGTTSTPIVTDRDLQHITSIGVFVNGNCEQPLYAAQFVRDNELSPIFSDPFDIPKFADNKGGVISHNVKYAYATRGFPAVKGYQFYPKQRLLINLKYLVSPSKIAIRNSALDQQVAGNPFFVLSATDRNSEFPEFIHNEIVRRAVALYTLSIPDLQQASFESQKALSGTN